MLLLLPNSFKSLFPQTIPSLLFWISCIKSLLLLLRPLREGKYLCMLFAIILSLFGTVRNFKKVCCAEIDVILELVW